MELETFLHDLANQPLPGGVAAAAHAAAMGAALLSKVARVTLRRPTTSPAVADRFQFLRAAADEQKALLVDLADEDTQAYRSLLSLKHSRADDAALRQAWSQVLAVPICVAESSHLLLRATYGIDEICPPHLIADLWIIQSLLGSGLVAGVWAAEANLQVCPSTLDTAPFRSRLQALSLNQQSPQPVYRSSQIE